MYYTDLATELITWLRSKTIVLGLLREVQSSTGRPQRAIIRAVLTRWTAHYQAFKRLLEVHQSLIALAHMENARPDDKKMIITGDKKARTRSRAMLDIIENSEFWHKLAR